MEKLEGLLEKVRKWKEMAKGNQSAADLEAAKEDARRRAYEDVISELEELLEPPSSAV